MAIENLGSKLYSGTKADRVSDSLGSSADGTNNGITQTISLNSSTNKVDFDAKRDGNNYAMSYDLGATISDTQWVARFPVTISTLTGNSGQNTLFMFFGLSSLDAKTGATSGSFDYIGTQLKKSSGASQWKAQAVDGGALNVEGTNFAHTLTTETVYVEIKRTGATSATVELFSDSGYSTSVESESLTPASTIQNLRYVWIGNQDSSGGTTNKIVGTVGEIKVWNSTTTASGTATYTASPNSTTNWTSGSAKLGTGAYSFDGTDDFTSFGEKSQWDFLNDDSTDFNISFWLKNEMGTVSSNKIWFSTYADNQADGILLQIRTGSGGGDNTFRVHFSSASANTNTGNTFEDIIPSASTWHHYSVNYDKTTKVVEVFKDGISQGTHTVSAHSYPAADQTLHIGARQSDGNFCNIDLDDMGIYKRKLTATEIGKLASNNVTKLALTAENGNSYVRTGAATIYGEQIQAGNPLIGQKLNNIVMKVSKSSGTNSGTIKVGIWNTSSGTTAKHTFWTGAGSGFVQESTPTNEVTFGLNGTTSIGGTHTTTESGVIAENDVIGIEATGSNIDYVYFRKTSAQGDGTSKLVEYQGGWSSGNYGTAWLKCNNGTPTAQLVSSLTDKSNLKAYYSMDSDTATQLFEVTGSDGTGWTSSGTSINFNSAHSNAIGSTSTSQNDYIVRSVSDLTGGSTTYFDNDKWFMDWEGYHTGNNNNLYIEAGSGNPSYSGSYYAIAFNLQDNGVDWYGILSNNNNGTRTENAGNANFAENTKGQIKYGRLIRDGNTITCKIWNTDSTRSGSPDYSPTQTINSAITNLDRLSIWANGNGGNYYFKNIKVYNGVTDPNQCKNDHSTTSDLETLTGVRTNSIFQQTDNTPSYWWYDGTDWKLDGTSSKSISLGTSDWTSTRTSSDGIPYVVSDGSELDFECYNHSSTIGSAIYDLGSALSDEKWVARIHINITKNSVDGSFMVSLTDTGGNVSTTTNADRIVANFYRDSSALKMMSTSNSANNFATNGSGYGSLYARVSTEMTGTGDFYIQIARKSATTGTIWAGSNSDYTSNPSGDIANLAATVDGLRYIQIQNNNHGTGSTSYDTDGSVKSITIQDGVSEWLE